MNSPFVLALGGASVLVLLTVSAFFSSSETAVFSLPREWIDEQVAAGTAGAATLQRLQDDQHGSS